VTMPHSPIDARSVLKTRLFFHGSALSADGGGCGRRAGGVGARCERRRMLVALCGVERPHAGRNRGCCRRGNRHGLRILAGSRCCRQERGALAACENEAAAGRRSDARSRRVGAAAGCSTAEAGWFEPLILGSGIRTVGSRPVVGPARAAIASRARRFAEGAWRAVSALPLGVSRRGAPYRQQEAEYQRRPTRHRCSEPVPDPMALERVHRSVSARRDALRISEQVALR
jgi:hypothetical protein